MPAFDNDTSAHANNSPLSLAERLKQTDDAYSRGAREECIQMVNDIYAYFDKAATGIAGSCTIAALTIVELLGAIA